MAVLERARQALSWSLTALAGGACAACCVIPLLLAVGVVGGAGWVALAGWMPGFALGLVALAGGAWWWTLTRRRHAGCGDACACGEAA